MEDTLDKTYFALEVGLENQIRYRESFNIRLRISPGRIRAWIRIIDRIRIRFRLRILVLVNL